MPQQVADNTIPADRSVSVETLSGPAAAPASPAAASPVPAPSPAQADSAARNAVNAALNLAEAQAGRSDAPVSSVSLNFKMGEENLSVRVEWRDGAVHAQFNTDSPELRSAIATEWQTMASSSAGRSLHLAAPVISGSGVQTGDTASSSSQGRGGDPRQQGQPLFGSSSQSGGRASISGASRASAQSRSGNGASGRPTGSNHLKTFA